MRQKPKVPYTGLSLTVRPNRPQCRKIRGKVHLIGARADPDATLDNYNRRAPDLKAGRKPRPTTPDTTPALRNAADRS